MITTVAQIEKYRTIHQLCGVFAMLSFAISIALILYMTLESVVLGLVFMIATIALKSQEVKTKTKKKKVFEQGLEKVISEYLVKQGAKYGSKLKPRSKKRFKYFVNVYEPVDTGELEREICKYSKETGIKIKFKVNELEFYDLFCEIFS